MSCRSSYGWFIVWMVVSPAISLPIANADTVWVAPSPPSSDASTWVPRPIRTYRGSIVAFDRKRCEIELDDGQRQTVAAHRVIAAIPETNDEASKMWIDAWRRSDDDGMIRSLTESLAGRPPVWRQQWMTAATAAACFRTGRDAIAYDLISQLDARPVPPMTVAAMDVGWQSGRPSKTASEAAWQRIEDPSPWIRFIAAARLLSSVHRDRALQSLNELARLRERPTIMVGARLLRAASVNPNELASRSAELRDQVARLPIVLQDGPRAMLIDRFTRAGLKDDAREMALVAQHAPSVSRLAAESREKIPPKELDSR